MNWPVFLNMGGYALYVWLSWGMALMIILINWFWPVLYHRKLRNRLRRDIRRRKTA